MRQDVSTGTMDVLKKKYQGSFRKWITGAGDGGLVLPYIGADKGTVTKWLEARLLVGMSWGTYGEIWVVDHVVPLRLFDMTRDEDLSVSLNYKNLMPLYKQDNMYKDGAIEFSIRIIDALPQCDVTGKLRAVLSREQERLNKYIHVIPR